MGDARGLRRAFSEADRASTGFAKGIAKAGVFAATGLAGIVAGVGVAAAKSVQAAQESNKVGKQTEAVLRSTGGAAKVTAKQVSDLATAISNKTGIDDEQVQASENMLLTFTNIRNAAGKNNDIFTQATKITQDMSVALGQDGAKSAIQLGKALNDPVKGVTALQRVGVTFTQQQRDQIKTLVESGRTMDAQRLILRELGKEFGGSAAAAATPLDKLKVIVGNVSEAVGNLLLPIVNKAATWLGQRLPGAVELLQTGLHALGAAFRGEGVTSTGFVGIMERIGVALSVVIPAVRRFASEQLPRLQHAAQIAGQFITGTLIPALVAIFKWINDHKTLVQSLAVGILAIVAAIKIWTTVTKTMAIVQAALNVVLSANPIGLVVLAIAGLAAGIIYAYRHSETFRRIVQGAFNGIKTVVGAVVTFIITSFRLWFNVATTVVGGIIGVFGKLPGPLGAPFRKAEEAVRKAKTTVNTELDKIQKRVNQLTGKDIPISASLKLNFSDSFTQKDWVQVRLAAGRMAGGGRVGGNGPPGRDSQLRVLAPDEHVWTGREVAAAGGHQAMLRWRQAVLRGGIPGMALGGPVGMIDAETGYINRVQARGTAVRMDRGISKLMGSFAGPGGARDVNSVARWTAAILGRAAEWAAWARRIMFESGGNWSAVNRTDSNWLAGHPSVGGAQVIRGTFARWAGPFRNIGPFLYGVSTNPRANSYAGGNYAIHTYGSLAAVDPRIRPIGYDSGGWLPPGLSMAWNGTGRPERVGGGDTYNFHFHGPVYGDEQALAARVRTAMRAQQRRDGVPPAQQLR